MSVLSLFSLIVILALIEKASNFSIYLRTTEKVSRENKMIKIIWIRDESIKWFNTMCNGFTTNYFVICMWHVILPICKWVSMFTEVQFSILDLFFVSSNSWSIYSDWWLDNLKMLSRFFPFHPPFSYFRFIQCRNWAERFVVPDLDFLTGKNGLSFSDGPKGHGILKTSRLGGWKARARTPTALWPCSKSLAVKFNYHRQESFSSRESRSCVST